MNKERFLSWWHGEVRWLSILMRGRVERRTLVKLTVVWALCALFIVLRLLGTTTGGDYSVWHMAVVAASAVLAYSAATDLSGIGN